MRKTYQVLAYVLAGLVVVQAMAIALGIAGLSHWIDQDPHHQLTKAAMDHVHFTGDVGFAIHFMDGTMLIPLVILLLLITSFFTHVAGATRLALILLGMVVLQVFLGLAADDVPYVILLHVLNAFGILAMAIVAGRRARDVNSSPAAPVGAAGATA